MGTHDSNQPPGAERPRRRMVLRKIADAAPLLPAAPPRAKEPSVAALPPRTARSSASSAARTYAPVATAASRAPSARALAPTPSSTIRPPVDPSNEAAVPIPLTRLHTPRAAFRSAIDFPTPGTTEEASVRETSSASLPPLVASLPPAAPPIYVPSPANRAAPASRTGRSIMVGSLAGLALLATIGGIAMGRRIAQPAAESSQPIIVLASPAAAPPPAAVAVPEAPAATAMPEPIMPTTTVEDLPKAASQPQRAAPAVVARPVVRASPPATVPPVAGVPATTAAAHAAQAAALGQPTQAAPEAPVQGSAKDPTAAEGNVAVPAMPAAAPPEVDPLVKAVKDDIQEEESRRR